ncbi:hypothetical protein [Thermus amyloliquefaciens]|uniref:hypothetical protein n=1 Tax=Thermus amyloliquefaciens TaxID=1449080 RepID=UPI00056F73B8|nr:hypothetical protein [Thermus amyloliquefaciens]
MRKWLILALALALAVGYAQVNFPSEGDLDGELEELWDDNHDQAAVKEKVKVIIPPRYALHLTEDEWNLNLNEPPEAPESYTFNPYDPKPPAEGCYLVPKTVKSPEDLINYALGGGIFRPIGAYPAAKDYDNDGKLSDEEKGTLICVNHKILQKFSNDPDGWQLSVSVTGTPASGFGWFGLADLINYMPMGGFYTNSLPYGPVAVAQGSGPTGGWLDDLIVEAFWFDGSELDGTYTIDVTFTLAGL